jgi:hypothetical protein
MHRAVLAPVAFVGLCASAGVAVHFSSARKRSLLN